MQTLTTLTLLLLSLPSPSSPHPDHLSCSTPVTTGTQMMGKEAVASSEKKVTVTGSTSGVITCDGAGEYIDGEALEVTISNSDGVLEVEGGEFSEGKR